MPQWVTTAVVLVVTALLAYNIVVVGPDGYPTTVILGGLLGGYAGINQILKGRGKDDDR